MLASLSGNTLPEVVQSQSGKLAILFTSDRDYTRSGFAASVYVDSGLCGGGEAGCGGRGACTANATCACFPGWTGSNCSSRWENSTEQERQSDGTVVAGGQPRSYTVPNRWSGHVTAAPTAFTARAGHTAVVVVDGPSAEPMLFVFGGFTLNGALAAPVTYSLAAGCDPATDCFADVTASTVGPDPRYWHSAVAVSPGEAAQGSAVYVFGGLLSGEPGAAGPAAASAWAEGDLSSELWKFEVSSAAWTLLGSAVGGGSDAPPAVALHTATHVGDAMVVLGGSVGHRTFNTHTYTYDLVGSGGWRQHTAAGAPTRISGHTAVYHASSGTIYVFGGYEPKWPGLAERSSTLRTYSVATHHWAVRAPSAE
jgi:hypothetical protein